MSIPELKWNQIVLDHQNSGLSIKEYCQSKGLRYHQFYHYKRKFSENKIKKSSFAKVKVIDQPPLNQPTRIVIYYNDLSLTVEGDQDLELIARLCHKLGQA